ncbi:hypothetical protein AB833_08465 [Chromatiales bacterium (ex Bugula neritina AB1)]|nr:hypothetical protein AB833_08465 [Chromatiales bacterium (ex Bugula neritina AB1)]
MQPQNPFPLRGVIGVVANSPDEIDLASAKGLQCVEIRADLLLDCGMALNELLSVIGKAKAADLATLFTLRHPTHGGKFGGNEDERVAINRRALSAGADIIDLEWNTDASAAMLAENVPMVLSYHDFTGMPDDSQLNSLTGEMCATRPTAIKIVPTASTTADAARMLRWSNSATPAEVVRIGFAMGESGSCSRILTTAFGAPITYASFGEAVAPGQVAIAELLNIYRVPELNQHTSVTAVAGDSSTAMETVVRLNEEYQAESRNIVAVNFAGASVEDLNRYRTDLRIETIHST